MAGTFPHKLGKVTQDTSIRCNQVVSQNVPMEAVEIMPMRRNQITSRSLFMNEYVKPFLDTLRPKELYTFKHGVLELENLRFLVKYARPEYGYLAPQTKVKVDEYAKPLSFI